MSTQSTFHAALWDANQPVPDGLLDAHGAQAGRRFSVYRNNVAVSLRDALRTGFPVLQKLLGEQNFDAVAGLYLRAHPPTSPLMMHYGADMPRFLEGFEPLRHIGYLPDVARLERAMRESYHSADATPFDPARLGILTPEALTRTTLTLSPAIRIIASDWPLYDIWRFNMVDGADKPRSIAQSVLITRAEFDPEPHPLGNGDLAWLTAIRDGHPMGLAQDRAHDAEPNHDLGPLLGLLIQNNALTDLTTKD